MNEAIAIFFSQFGPYHHARVKALQEILPGRVVPVQIASSSATYQWDTTMVSCDGLVTLFEGLDAEVSARDVFWASLGFLRRRKVAYSMIPSYHPPAITALYAASTVARCRKVMMNDSHLATQCAKGWKLEVKKAIVRNFDSALVAGAPHMRYFSSMGISAEKIFTGYDAVHNEYYTGAAQMARENGPALRKQLGLPDRYFLNLGRFVAKKDLSTLVEAFACFRKISSESVDLVLVGAGEEEHKLKGFARSLGLAVRDATDASVRLSCSLPTVYFYGFKQISETPVFYALAEAFILPSVVEEWGLVVNEAMACGLPVVVSAAAGCAEDLVQPDVNGFLFRGGDVETLARCLLRLAQDAPMRERMARASQELISKWGCGNFAVNAVNALKAAGMKC